MDNDLTVEGYPYVSEFLRDLGILATLPEKMKENDGWEKLTRYGK